MKPRTKTGHTYVQPNGIPSGRIFVTIEGAQSEAAFCMSQTNGIELPRDWDEAYRVGYRIVTATLTTGPGKRSWKKYAGHK